MTPSSNPYAEAIRDGDRCASLRPFEWRLLTRTNPPEPTAAASLLPGAMKIRWYDGPPPWSGACPRNGLGGGSSQRLVEGVHTVACAEHGEVHCQCGRDQRRCVWPGRQEAVDAGHGFLGSLPGKADLPGPPTGALNQPLDCFGIYGGDADRWLLRPHGSLFYPVPGNQSPQRNSSHSRSRITSPACTPSQGEARPASPPRRGRLRGGTHG